MLNRETLLTLFDVSIKSLAFNLDFIPADKLNWQPAPEAKSALEITNHLAEFLGAVSSRLKPEDSGAPAFAEVTTLDEAKHVLAEAAERFTAVVCGASSAILEEKFRENMPFTNGWIVTAAIMDAVHHHGQIAYIQTMLGDTEIHSDPSALADFAIG